MCHGVPLHDVVRSRDVGAEGVESVACVHDNGEQSISLIDCYAADVEAGVVRDTGELEDVDDFVGVWVVDCYCCVP